MIYVVCNGGYASVNSTCVDVCNENNPCENGATCSIFQGAALCNCQPPYTGVNCTELGTGNGTKSKNEGNVHLQHKIKNCDSYNFVDIHSCMPLLCDNIFIAACIIVS